MFSTTQTRSQRSEVLLTALLARSTQIMMLQSSKEIGMRSEGGYETVPLDKAQQDDFDIPNGCYMHACFDQSLSEGSFQGLLQRRVVG